MCSDTHTVIINSNGVQQAMICIINGKVVNGNIRVGKKLEPIVVTREYEMDDTPFIETEIDERGYIDEL